MKGKVRGKRSGGGRGGNGSRGHEEKEIGDEGLKEEEMEGDVT